jgi:hypothetical protein
MALGRVVDHGQLCRIEARFRTVAAELHPATRHQCFVLAGSGNVLE